MIHAAPLERPTTLKDLAYRKIKESLVSGRLELEKVYSGNQFADLLGVSRTPVREALLQLSAEGLLVFVDGRGFKVKTYSRKEIRDIFEARRAIETYVIERLVGTLDPDALQVLDGNLGQLSEQAVQKDPHRFLETDRGFHMSLVRVGGNVLLESIMDAIRNHVSVLGLSALAHEGRARQVVEEHGAIIQALRRKDKAAAVEALVHHLATTETYALDRAQKE
jgi:GntR family transcriptional regulator, rspAB operon transcriptional repressor